MARGFDFGNGKSNDAIKEAMVPIAGPGHNILHMDFYIGADKSWIYWVDFDIEDEEHGHNGIYR